MARHPRQTLDGLEGSAGRRVATRHALRLRDVDSAPYPATLSPRETVGAQLVKRLGFAALVAVASWSRRMKTLGDRIRPALRKHDVQLLSSSDLADFLKHRECDVVLDVGANVGQFAGKARRSGLSRAYDLLRTAERLLRQVATSPSVGPPLVDPAPGP